MTELAPNLLDADDARRLTERIRLIAGNVADNVEKLRELVEQARVGQAHVALGYDSWTGYLRDVFGDEPLRLAGDVRQEIAAELADKRVSVPVIATVLGVSDRTIQRDLQGVTSVTPSKEVRIVDGLDGKTYATPIQRQNRRALTDVAKDAGWDIRKAAERLDRIRDDDRYSRNKEEVAALLRAHLLFAIETCQGLLDEFDEKQGD